MLILCSMSTLAMILINSSNDIFPSSSLSASNIVRSAILASCSTNKINIILHEGSLQQVALLWQRDRATCCQSKFCNYKTSHLKTRVPGLSCGIICVILRLAVFVQYRSVTETQRRTDGRTDTRRRHVSRLA